MTRFDPDPSAPRPTPHEEESADTMLERWLARAPRSLPRLRTWAAPQPAPPREPLGDELADRWFK